MQLLKPLEPGVMFWAGRDGLEEIASLGVRCGQLGIPGEMELTSSAAGPLNIEREVDDRDEWLADIRKAIQLLQRLVSS